MTSETTGMIDRAAASSAAWRDLALPLDLRRAVERAAAAEGVDPVSWLAKAVVSAAENGTTTETSREAEITRSLTRLLAAVRARDGQSSPDETAGETQQPKPTTPEPPPLIRLTAERTPIEDTTEAMAAAPPRPRRRYGVPLLLGGLLVAALAGIAAFYLGLDRDAGVREASVSAPLPQAAPPSAPPTATASAPPAPASPATAPPGAQATAPTPSAAAPPAPAAPAPATTASAQPAATTTVPGETASSSAAGTSDSPETATAGSADISMGDALAAFRLGVRYAFGEGVAQDYQKAAEQFRIAAQQGLPDAQYNLGALYDNGLGLPRDPVRAVIWYHSAAEAGHPSAQLNLGLAYANGSGVAQDYGEAARWFRRAADQGIVTAQYNLAALYANGKGVAPSLVDAYAWFSIAAASGDTEAQRQMQRTASALPAKQLRDAKALAASLSQQIGHSNDPQTHDSAAAAEGTGDTSPHGSGATAASSPAKPSTPPPDRAIVSEIQRYLIHLHYDPGRADGVVSDKTADAIRKFQADHKLNVDGEPTRVLLFRLKAEVQQQAKQ